MDILSHSDEFLIGCLVLFIGAIYKGMRDLVKNDLTHAKAELILEAKVIFSSLQAEIKTLGSKVGFLSSDINKLNGRIDKL